MSSLYFQDYRVLRLCVVRPTLLKKKMKKEVRGGREFVSWTCWKTRKHQGWISCALWRACVSLQEPQGLMKMKKTKRSFLVLLLFPFPELLLFLSSSRAIVLVASTRKTTLLPQNPLWRALSDAVDSYLPPKATTSSARLFVSSPSFSSSLSHADTTSRNQKKNATQLTTLAPQKGMIFWFLVRCVSLFPFVSLTSTTKNTEKKGEGEGKGL